MSDVIWNPGAPPKRGVYRVKSDGPSSNTGYRYWSGERWGGLSSRRVHAVAMLAGRNTPLKYPVLWASAAPAPTIWSDEFQELLYSYRIASDSKAGAVREAIIAHIDAKLNSKAKP